MTMEANEMLAEPEKQEELRRYLLGMVSDEERLESFEERIMADEEFSEILSMAEDDLIDDYLGDQLPADERERFSKYFLITDDRRRKFRFAEKLKSYATAVPASKESETRRPGFFSLLFMSPAFRFAVIAVLLAGSGFLFGRTFVYQSDIDRGLAELRQAYKGRRPTEARTSIAISYAPFVVTRGDGDPATDPAARDRAQLMQGCERTRFLEGQAAETSRP